MNKILGFIKSNLVIVISVVLILAVLPVGYVFSSKWNKQVHTQASDAYNKEKRALTSKGSITYSLPAVLDGEEDLSESRAPNAAVTRFYVQAKAQREGQVQDVVERGTAFNRGDHVELVEGILPAASDQATLARLARAMGETIAGTNTGPSAYQRKLQRLNAGSPPSSDVLAETLDRVKIEDTQRYENSNADGKMTAAQQEQLGKDLVSRRLAEYIGRAKSLTFYCSPSAFVNGEPNRTATATSDGYSVVPSFSWPPSKIDEATVYNWLWDFWVISDVLDAAALANRDPQTGAMAVPDAPVKRIESIRVSALDLPEDDAGSSDDVIDDDRGFGTMRRDNRDRSYSSGGGGSDDASKAPQGTVTGREGGGADSAYDIRTVDLVAVVSSQDLPRFIDAIGKTNYMTVTDLDLSEVDVWADLQQGYYYGEDHVVRVSMSIESVWLRSWLTPLMPDKIKTALGVPVEADDSEG